MNIIEKIAEYENTVEKRGYYYKVSDMLKILILGLFCSLTTLYDIHVWANSPAAKSMLLEHFGIAKLPCYSHFTNLIALIDHQKLNDIFMDIFGSMVHNLTSKTIAIDGKTICSTANMRNRQKALHIASAYVTEIGLTIGQVATEEKSNEIPAVQELLALIDLTNATIVTDALNCQKKTAKRVIDGGGNYLFSVKKNHKNLYEDIAEFFDYKQTDHYEIRSAPLLKTTESEKSHGRLEKRTAYVTHDVEWLENRDKWDSLCCLGKIEKESVDGDKVSRETRYYISSRTLSPTELLKLSRSEWGIESMHWQLDVIFGEDRTLSSSDNIQKALNILRKTVLNCIRIYRQKFGLKTSMAGHLKRCLFDPGVLLRTISDVSQFTNVSEL